VSWDINVRKIKEQAAGYLASQQITIADGVLREFVIAAMCGFACQVAAEAIKSLRDNPSCPPAPQNSENGRKL
jgi:hypothetical protein